MLLKSTVNLASRFLASILSEIVPPTITLSPFLFLIVHPDKVVLSDNLSERRIDLSRDEVRTILDSARLASSSGQIRAIDFDGFTIETDDGPPNHPMIFDYNPISWIWKPRFVTLKPTTDYIAIDVKWASGRIRGFIENARVDLAYTELARIDAKSTATGRSQ